VLDTIFNRKTELNLQLRRPPVSARSSSDKEVRKEVKKFGSEEGRDEK
jgi:hypothetical protein